MQENGCNKDERQLSPLHRILQTLLLMGQTQRPLLSESWKNKYLTTDLMSDSLQDRYFEQQ